MITWTQIHQEDDREQKAFYHIHMSLTTKRIDNVISAMLQ